MAKEQKEVKQEEEIDLKKMFKSTMNLNISKSQKEQKDNILLPFMNAQKRMKADNIEKEAILELEDEDKDLEQDDEDDIDV